MNSDDEKYLNLIERIAIGIESVIEIFKNAPTPVINVHLPLPTPEVTPVVENANNNTTENK